MFNFAQLLRAGERACNLMVKLRLRELLEERHMSQAALSRELGVSTISVNGWVVGRRFPPVETLARVAEILGVHITELFEPPTS